MITRKKSKEGRWCKKIASIFVFIAAICVFSTKSFAQYDMKTPMNSEKVTRGKGISQALFTEYQEIVGKYLGRYSVGNPNENDKYFWNSECLSEEDWSRLYVIYFQMNGSQKEEQKIKFYGPPTFKGTRTPNAKLYDLWIEDDKSIIWINGECVEKSALSSYKVTDFVRGHTSSLLRSEKQDRYRVDLWTKKGYDSFRKQFAKKPVSIEKLLEIEPEIIFVMERDGEKYISMSKQPIFGWSLTSIDEITKTKTLWGATKTNVKSTGTIGIASSPLSYHQKEK